MKNLIVNGFFHLHGSSIKFPFIFHFFFLLCFIVLVWCSDGNSCWAVTYIVYHFKVNFDIFTWALFEGRNCSAFRYIWSHSYFSYTEQNNIESGFVTINIMISNSRFTEFVSCLSYSSILCLLCATTHILAHSLYCVNRPLNFVWTVFLFVTSETGKPNT